MKKTYDEAILQYYVEIYLNYYKWEIMNFGTLMKVKIVDFNQKLSIDY
jgi:hypothetical protein